MAAHKAKLVLYLTIINTLVSLVLSKLFIMGTSNWTGLGIKGYGISQSLSAWAGLALTFLFLLSQEEFRKFHLFQFRKNTFNIVHVKYLVLQGLPIGLELLVGQITIFLMTLLVTYYDLSTLGTYQIALQTLIIFTATLYSAAQVASYIIGPEYGSGQYANAIKISHYSIIYSITICCLASLVFFFFPQKIAKFFGGSHGSFEVLKNLFILQGITLMIDAPGQGIAGVFRGFGITKKPFYITSLSILVFLFIISLLIYYNLITTINILIARLLAVLFSSLLLFLQWSFFKNKLFQAIYTKNNL